MISMFAGWGLHLAALTLAARAAATARGWRLWLALYGFALIVGSVSPLIEAVAFGVLSPRLALGAAAFNLATFAVIAAVAVLISGRLTGTGSPPARVRATPLRLLGVILAYQGLYFAAGMLAYPYVRDFYADKHLPGLVTLQSLQVVRALLYALAAWLLLRSRARYPELVLGVGFSVIGGLALLIGDNPFMPAHIRAVHAVEVGISNFLFGMITAWLLKPKASVATAQGAPTP